MIEKIIDYSFYPYKRKASIRYKLNDKVHREVDPALIQYYENENIMSIGYYKNDKLHREDGPALIQYYKYRNIRSQYYWIRGCKLTEQEWFSQLSVENKLKIAFGTLND